MFNFALILNLNNNIVTSMQHVISQFITYSIYHLHTISITISLSQYNNIAIIIIREELQYNKHPKRKPNLIP